MFGFPKNSHKSFKKNFLKRVIYQILYDENELFQHKKEAIKNLFNEQFPNQSIVAPTKVEISFSQTQTQIINEIKEDDVLELKSQDGQKVLRINNSSFSLTINGIAYKDYESLKNDLKNLKNLLKLLEISEINRVAIRKINIVEFKLIGNPSELLQYIINSNLIGNLSYFPSCEKIYNNLQSLNYRDNENNLNLKYGLNIHPSKEKGRVIIDIDLFKQSTVLSKEIFSLSDEINNEIFNIFNWVLNPKALELLDE
ncbi:hypothetical protein BH23BAC1_BH23BAC1_40820 [soil metagenome]